MAKKWTRKQDGVKDWWTGKSEAEIAKTLATNERDFYAANSHADEYDEVAVADFSLTPVTLSLAEEDAEASREKVALFYSRLADWKKANKVKAKLEDTLTVFVALDAPIDAHISDSDLSDVLGVARAPAKKRHATLLKYMPAIRQIATEEFG